MAASGAHESSVLTELLAAADDLRAAVEGIRSALARTDGTALGEGLIKIREVGIDALRGSLRRGPAPLR